MKKVSTPTKICTQAACQPTYNSFSHKFSDTAKISKTISNCRLVGKTLPHKLTKHFCIRNAASRHWQKHCGVAYKRLLTGAFLPKGKSLRTHCGTAVVSKRCCPHHYVQSKVLNTSSETHSEPPAHRHREIRERQGRREHANKGTPTVTLVVSWHRAVQWGAGLQAHAWLCCELCCANVCCVMCGKPKQRTVIRNARALHLGTNRQLT